MATVVASVEHLHFVAPETVQEPQLAARRCGWHVHFRKEVTMPAAVRLRLRPREEILTEDLRKHTAKPWRVVRGLVQRGELRRLSRGLYASG